MTVAYVSHETYIDFVFLPPLLKGQCEFLMHARKGRE